MLQQQLPRALHFIDSDTQLVRDRARAREYRNLKSSAAQCFRADTHDPMIGGRELNVLLSKQNSIDQTLGGGLGGGLGGMEDDENFRKFVAGAQLTRQRQGTVPRRNADVMDVVRYTD